MGRRKRRIRRTGKAKAMTVRAKRHHRKGRRSHLSLMLTRNVEKIVNEVRRTVQPKRIRNVNSSKNLKRRMKQKRQRKNAKRRGKITKWKSRNERRRRRRNLGERRKRRSSCVSRLR